jgi:phosphoenolpyruvate synthase/pyruvate phosphate dikinase
MAPVTNAAPPVKLRQAAVVDPSAMVGARVSEPLILALDSPDATLERVGGKGASLAQLAAAGLPVPPGFHLTTRAYRRFVDENHLGAPVLAAAAQARADDSATLDRASDEIRLLMAGGQIPADLAALIVTAYQGLGAGDPPVAVRSSATAEDLPEMSFAGQQDTYLNVRGAEGVLSAVKRCWASLWTARDRACRLRRSRLPSWCNSSCRPTRRASSSPRTRSPARAT